MTPGPIARRYARALFELASGDGVAAPVGEGLAELAAAVASLDDGVLAPGSMAPAERERLSTALVQRIGADSLLGHFVGVLAANDRLDQLPAIRGVYEKLEDAAAGRVRVRVRSATPLTEADRDALRRTFEKITGHTVLDSVDVDADLLGGVSVEAEGRVYDGSVKTQIARLERAMAGQAS